MIHGPLARLARDPGQIPEPDRNALWSAVRSRRPMRTPVPDPVAAAEHKWKTTCRRTRTAGIWRVEVDSGCVNDEPAAILWQRHGDPRGWEMPENYGPFAKLAAVYGADYPFVDRPIYETGRDRPFLLLTAPSADGTEPGGFERITDFQRASSALEVFRTRAMWERELWRAHVVVSATPFRGDPQAIAVRIGGPLQKRWRVHAGQLPIRIRGSGVKAIDFHELARIYLVRIPGRPEADRVFVEQRAFWSLQSRSSVPQSLIDLADAVAQSAAALDIALLGFGPLGIATSVSLLGIEAVLTDIFLANLETTAGDSSSVEFWSV